MTKIGRLVQELINELTLAITIKPKNRIRAAYNLLRYGKIVTDEYTLPDGFMADYHTTVHETTINYDTPRELKTLGVIKQ